MRILFKKLASLIFLAAFAVQAVNLPAAGSGRQAATKFPDIRCQALSLPVINVRIPGHPNRVAHGLLSGWVATGQKSALSSKSLSNLLGIFKKYRADLMALAVFAAAFVAASHSRFQMAGAVIFASRFFFPAYEPHEMLTNVMSHRISAANRLEVSAEELKDIISPKRIIYGRFNFRRDNGTLYENALVSRFSSGPGSKGGIRSVAGLVVQVILSLFLDMDVKLPPEVTVDGVPLRGGKGGSDVNLNVLSKAEKARWMRGWVRKANEIVWDDEKEVAFGPLFDTPAPDVGTSQPDINLMDYFADEHVRFLVERAKEILPWLRVHDQATAKDLEALLKSDAKDKIIFDPAGAQEEMPYSDRVLALHRSGELGSLRLLACVTGKSVDRGGIEGRGAATGMGLVLSILDRLQLKSLRGLYAIVEGYGNVGHGAVEALNRVDATVLAIAEYDSATKLEFALFAPGGFNQDLVKKLDAFKKQNNGSLFGFEQTPEGRAAGVKILSKDEFWDLQTDILIPASAKEGTITEAVAKRTRARVLAEGTNGATRAEADPILVQRQIKMIVDVIGNAGGVAVSWLEMLKDTNRFYAEWPEAVVNAKLEEFIEDRFKTVEDYANPKGLTIRDGVHDLWLKSRIAMKSFHADLIGNAFPSRLEQRMRGAA